MALPLNPATFGKSLDPQEELDFVAPCDTLLEPGEEIDPNQYTVALWAEAVALGLEIMEGDGRDHALIENGTAVKLWFEIAIGFEGNAAFDGAGTLLPIEITFKTTSVPPRTRNRVFLLRVQQQ